MLPAWEPSAVRAASLLLWPQFRLAAKAHIVNMASFIVKVVPRQRVPAPTPLPRVRELGHRPGLHERGSLAYETMFMIINFGIGFQPSELRLAEFRVIRIVMPGRSIAAREGLAPARPCPRYTRSATGRAAGAVADVGLAAPARPAALQPRSPPGAEISAVLG
jgi:hypothetical protein